MWALAGGWGLDSGGDSGGQGGGGTVQYTVFCTDNVLLFITLVCLS